MTKAMDPHSDHELEITVGNGGKLDVKVHFRGQVPNHLAAFSERVRRRALMFFWFKSPYERMLWKATKSMPWWGRMTVRQHLLRERAIRIQAKLDAADAKAKAKADAVRVIAHQKVAGPAQPIATEKAQEPRVADARPIVVAPVRVPVPEVVREVESRPMEASVARATPPRKKARSERLIPFPDKVQSAGTGASQAIATRDPNLLSPMPGRAWRDAGTAWSAPIPSRSPFLELIRHEVATPLAYPVAIDRGRGR